MTHSRDHVIIEDYKTPVTLYFSWLTVPAWVLVAAPLVLGFVLGAWVF